MGRAVVTAWLVQATRLHKQMWEELERAATTRFHHVQDAVFHACFARWYLHAGLPAKWQKPFLTNMRRRRHLRAKRACLGEWLVRAPGSLCELGV